MIDINHGNKQWDGSISYGMYVWLLSLLILLVTYQHFGGEPNNDLLLPPTPPTVSETFLYV